MVEQTMEAVVRAGLPAGRGDLEVVGSEDAATWANACLSQHAAAARSLVGLHVSSKWFESGWTADDLVDLMQRLLTADSGRAIVLTWGPGDRVAAGSLLDAAATRSDGRALSPAVAGDPTHGARAVLAGRALLVAVDFPRWAALLSRCDVIVTRDTASLHLASALGRPVVAVYAVAGFVRNSQQFAPWRVAHAIVRDGPFGTVGQEVVEAVGRLVGASPRRGSARP
jgi:ADP-heptose:LPS heptosyltransferase